LTEKSNCHERTDTPDLRARCRRPDIAMSDDDVVRFLRGHPDFFQQHPDLFTELLLPDPHDGNAVSLIERQAVLLRERVKALESRLAELLRIGRDNDLLARHLIEWTKSLLAEPDRSRIGLAATDALKRVFGVPLVEVRIWGATPAPTDAAAVAWAARLPVPLCGIGLDLSALHGLPDTWANARSAALIPLRNGNAPPFGLIVMGSSDATRFDANLGTAVLTRIGELASAALAPAGPMAAA
jgi:uncharacterized protein YigA (DUF484 family)